MRVGVCVCVRVCLRRICVRVYGRPCVHVCVGMCSYLLASMRVGVVDWSSGNIPVVARLGRVAVGSNLRRTLAAFGVWKSLCVRPVYGL